MATADSRVVAKKSKPKSIVSDVGKNYPLYDMLAAETKNITLNLPKLFAYINKSIEDNDIDTQEIVYLLIKCHSIEKNELTTFGMQCSNGVTFDLTNLPLDLQKIIYLFYIKQEKKLDEEKN